MTKVKIKRKELISLMLNNPGIFTSYIPGNIPIPHFNLPDFIELEGEVVEEKKLDWVYCRKCLEEPKNWSVVYNKGECPKHDKPSLPEPLKKSDLYDVLRLKEKYGTLWANRQDRDMMHFENKVNENIEVVNKIIKYLHEKETN